MVGPSAQLVDKRRPAAPVEPAVEKRTLLQACANEGFEELTAATGGTAKFVKIVAFSCGAAFV